MKSPKPKTLGESAWMDSIENPRTESSISPLSAQLLVILSTYVPHTWTYLPFLNKEKGIITPCILDNVSMKLPLELHVTGTGATLNLGLRPRGPEFNSQRGNPRTLLYSLFLLFASKFTSLLRTRKKNWFGKSGGNCNKTYSLGASFAILLLSGPDNIWPHRGFYRTVLVVSLCRRRHPRSHLGGAVLCDVMMIVKASARDISSVSPYVSDRTIRIVLPKMLDVMVQVWKSRKVEVWVEERNKIIL